MRHNSHFLGRGRSQESMGRIEVKKAWGVGMLCDMAALLNGLEARSHSLVISVLLQGP